MCPCVSDLVHEVSDANGALHGLLLFVLPGGVPEAAGGSQRMVGDDLEFARCILELLGLRADGIADEDTSFGRRVPVQRRSSSCTAQWWPGCPSADNPVLTPAPAPLSSRLPLEGRRSASRGGDPPQALDGLRAGQFVRAVPAPWPRNPAPPRERPLQNFLHRPGQRSA